MFNFYKRNDLGSQHSQSISLERLQSLTIEAVNCQGLRPEDVLVPSDSDINNKQ